MLNDDQMQKKKKKQQTGRVGIEPTIIPLRRERCANSQQPNDINKCFADENDYALVYNKKSAACRNQTVVASAHA